MTYTNDDIMTFSRAWTGHVRQDARGNIENADGAANGGRNHLDPMRLVPGWRDGFPKLDLHGGYIGDGYPLCRDLPPRSFLRRGALYSYRGATVSTSLQESYGGAAVPLQTRARHCTWRCATGPPLQSHANFEAR